MFMITSKEMTTNQSMFKNEIIIDGSMA